MKPKSTLRSFLAIASSSLLAISYSHAANQYWSADGLALGGATGTWSNSFWGAAATGPFASAWADNNTAVLGGTAGTVSLGSDVTVGGLQFNTTAYVLAGDGLKKLSFNTGDNTILFNNGIAAASTSSTAGVGLKLGGSGNVILSAANPSVAGTLTLGYAVAGDNSLGWSGSTTITPGMTLLLNGRDLGLSSTSGITLNGGAITSTNTSGQAAFNRINDSAGIAVNGGGTFNYTNTSGATYAETLGAVTLNGGQLNLVLTTNQSVSQTLTLGSLGNNVSGSGLSRAATSAVTFSAGTAGPNATTNRVAVYGSTNTTAGEIVGPWATTGTAANAQTDYAVYDTDFVKAAGIPASAESSPWSTTHALTSNYTLTNATKSAANGLLSATRSVNTVRNTTASNSATATNGGVASLDYFTLAGHAFANGDVVSASGTGGLLNGGDTYYVINSGAGVDDKFQLSTTPGGSAVDLTNTTAGVITGGITLSTGNNLETYGILNGNAAALAIGASGTGALTTPTGGGNLFLTTGSGGIYINAPITNAAGGGAVKVVRSGTAGRLNLSGNNAFTGGLVVNGGVSGSAVQLFGTQSFTGGITLNGGGIGENSANSTPITQAAALNGNAITVNGPSHLVVEGTLGTTSTIAINSNAILKLGAANSALTVQGVVSGSGVLDANPNNVNSNTTLNLTNTANSFSGDVIYAASNGNTTLSVSSIGDTGKVVVGLAVNSVTKTFALNSLASAALTFNIRQFELTGISGAHNLGIANNSAQAFNINTDLLVTGTGTRTLTLGGTGAGLGTFAGKLTNGNLTSLGLTKADSASTWSLTNTANSYTGRTTITAGTLQVAALANAGSNSSIGASTGAGSLILNGGTLRYAGGLVSMNRNFALTASSSIDASGLGAVDFSQTGAVSPDQTLTGDVAASKLVTNLSSTADLVVGMRVTGAGIATNSTIASIDSSSQITLNNTPTAGTGVSLSFGYTASARTLTLTGTNTGANTIAGVLQNTFAAGPGTGVLSLTKAGIGTWVLTNANTYTGTTTASGGILKLNNATALPGGTAATGGTSNLSLSGSGIVGLTSDFLRARGTTAEQVQWTGSGGFAAYGGDRTVNLGGAAAGAQWATGSFVTAGQQLVLSAADSDGTLIWENPINFAGSSRTILVNNGSAAVDARLNGALSAGGGPTKTGLGTLEITSTSNSYTGATTVSAGTLRLGANDVIPNTVTSTISLGAGTLDAATFTDTVGTLDVTDAASTINLGSGAKLAFAASNAVDWTLATAGTLNITGTFVPGNGVDPGVGSNPGSLRFGTSNAGLTAGQLSQIIASGWTTFGLDAFGYLTATPTGSNTYATWIAGFSVGGQTGINDDFDNDGLGNALENLMGTSPVAFNQGLTTVSSTGGNLKFRHTLSTTPASDLTGAYEWSVNLSNWNASGASASGTTVTFGTPVVITPGTPNLVEVTATASGTPSAKIFGRFKATQP